MDIQIDKKRDFQIDQLINRRSYEHKYLDRLRLPEQRTWTDRYVVRVRQVCVVRLP